MQTNVDDHFEEWGFWKRITRRKLRNYLFLNKKLQFHFALLLAVVGAVNAFYFSALFYFYSQESLFRVAQWIPDYVLEEVLSQQFRLWSRTIVFVVSFELILVLLLGLFFSHRIAGPLYVMALRLKDIAKGIAPRLVRLRKNDLLTEFADDLNEAITVLRTQHAEITATLQEIDEGKLDSVRSRLKKLVASGAVPLPSSLDEPSPPASM